ncbi:MAG TPA: MmcQ/YjbR family DNA-binding protein [Allosphingosinicella sp.]|nr:MmcQ/YjbR family DNA-binding protein [Allosphingosinicella sp.]
MAGPAFAALRAHGLGFPEAFEDFPWGHTALKVRGKIFATLVDEDGTFSLTVKLPASRDFALVFDSCAPTGYGLGRSGWITARFRKGEAPDAELLKRWLAESYRAVAPKRLAVLLPETD